MTDADIHLMSDGVLLERDLVLIAARDLTPSEVCDVSGLMLSPDFTVTVRSEPAPFAAAAMVKRSVASVKR